MSRTLHPTRIDIPDDMRSAVVELLNSRLADAIDLSSQMKQAHWNVKGPSFIALHELFDAVHNAVRIHIDDIAERITALGGTARGTAAVAASASTLPEYPLEIHSGSEHVNAVSAALAACGKGVRAAIAKAQRSATRTPRTCSSAFRAISTRICGWSRPTCNRNSERRCGGTVSGCWRCSGFRQASRSRRR